jgi:hypothetical protein
MSLLRKEEGTALVPGVPVVLLVAVLARFLAADFVTLVPFLAAFFEDFVTMLTPLVPAVRDGDFEDLETRARNLCETIP